MSNVLTRDGNRNSTIDSLSIKNLIGYIKLVAINLFFNSVFIFCSMACCVPVYLEQVRVQSGHVVRGYMFRMFLLYFNIKMGHNGPSTLFHG